MDETLLLIDSHAHLDMPEFDQDRDEVIHRAFGRSVKSILCPAEITVPQSILTVLELASKFDSIVAAAGVHPHQAQSLGRHHLKKIENLAGEKKIKAVGEIGLDYHYTFSSPGTQQEAFRAQLRVAQDLALPVIIHSRLSGKDILSAVREESFRRGGVLHCFTEDWETAREMMDLGFLISFSGILTFPNAQPLREVAQRVPVDKLLVETDSPYLVPSPLRGKVKRNEPCFVIETARVLAGLKHVSLEKLARTTSRNFENLFVVEKKNVQC